jgi:ABC-type transport system involved in multi-copper enzyme maturation permease subunit
MSSRRAGARPPPRWPARWHAIRVLQARDLRSLLYSPAPYLAVALGVLAALPIMRGHLETIRESRVLLLSDALTLPFFIGATIAQLYLALASVATVARERESGTLEALFYGPVDHTSYVLAKQFAHLAAYLPMAVATALLLLAYAGVAGLRPGTTLAPALALSVATAAAVAALGILLSTLTRSARAAFGLFGLISLAFLAVRVGAELLSGLTVANNLSPLLFLRDLALGLDRALGLVSPFALFQDGVDAAVRGDAAGYAAALALSALECAILLLLAVRALERRGVRR